MATPDVVSQMKARNKQVLDEAEASFQNSELLRTLKERSDANRAGGWAPLVRAGTQPCLQGAKTSGPAVSPTTIPRSSEGIATSLTYHGRGGATAAVRRSVLGVPADVHTSPGSAFCSGADRKKALEERYCMRQAELGVGDCGGLR